MRDKIKTREELARVCVDFRNRGRKVGFTSGIFDILHAGHADYLEEAKKICDVLVVGVNADSSVKKLKGDRRPVFGEAERVKLVSSLEPVDYVFLFSEERNEQNIKALKPDYYIKAGDYTRDKLSSARVAESCGGQVRIIKRKFDVSTTGTIEKVLALYGDSVVRESGTVHIQKTSLKRERAVFLDRDGTINRDAGYLHEFEKFEFLPNALAGIRKMQDMGFKLAIVTTQAGIGLGYFSKEDFYRLSREMMRKMSEAGITISKIYFCPHGKDEDCSCRKPGTALVELAARDLNLDLGKSYFVGDTPADIEAGKRTGTGTILIRGEGEGNEDEEFPVEPDYVAGDLLDAAGYISRDSRINRHS